MNNVSQTTINYLNSLYTTTENGKRHIDAIKSFLDGPFRLVLNIQNFDVFEQFLNTGKFKTAFGTKGEERESLSFDLAESPKKLFAYDPNDILLVSIIDACINTFVNDEDRRIADFSVDEKVQAYYKIGNSLDASKSLNDIRKHFYDNYLFDYDNFYTQNAAGRTLKKFNSGADPIKIAQILKLGMLIRINAWIGAKNRVLESAPPFSTDEEALIKIEKTSLSEEYSWEQQNVSANSGLWDFLNKALNPDGQSPEKPSIYQNNIFAKAFGNIPKTDSSERNYFLNVFKGSSLERASQLHEKQLVALIAKMEESGLLTLARYAGSMAQFAETRLSSVEQLKRSAIDSVKPERDVAWLQQLTQVLQKLSRDPLTLATINIYFPSLITFFFDALAVTADYSNGGKRRRAGRQRK